MSRRKQAKPQHIKTDGVTFPTETLSQNDILESPEREYFIGGQSQSSSEETHICEKCCADVFTWAQLCDHHKVCTKDPLVLIVQDDERMPALEDCPVEASPVSSVVPSDSTAAESLDGGVELGETLLNEHNSSEVLEENRMLEEPMELEDKHTVASSPQAQNSTGSISPQMSAAGKYSMPSTNVTLEILHSTRVAVAQFSQGVNGGDHGEKRASDTIPVILEHLLALQQQQVYQLELIEKICSQVATINKQPTQAALNPASRALSLTSNAFPPLELIPPPVLPLSGTMPSAVNGQASVSLSSVLQRSQSLSLQTTCGQSTLRGTTCTSSSCESPAPPPSSCSSSSVSTLLPPYAGTNSSLASCTLSSSSPLSLGQGSILSSPSSLPFLPQSPPSSAIFPNPLASIAATANALDPLAALMKHRKGKLSGVSLFDTRPSAEEPFFKHKCRFCAKVFGSDSALQIHLRSHTGERPFKCNICGNRFSTKGNLKVHFQRHKEKYPHVQMNPYPVPEYLDNVPTSSGIPYGMSFPLEKAGSSWVDSKPVVATLPAPKILPLVSTLSSMGSSNDSVTSSAKSPHRPVSGVPLLFERVASEPHSLPVAGPLLCSCENEAKKNKMLETEGVHLPQNCSNRPQANPIDVATSTVIPSVSTTTVPSNSASSVPSSPPLLFISDQITFSSGALLDSIQTSETSKLQQLVENIDKKVADPNQCVVCHRVLSCQSALKMHYRIHTGERPFKCKVCGRAFTTKGNLKTHVGVHKENPPIQVQHSCPICHKKFTNAVILQQHIHMHMGGQIPDSMVDRLREVDDNIYLGENSENNFDSLSSNDNDLMDNISMDDDEEEEEEAETAEEGVSPYRSLSSVCYSPSKPLPVVSSIAALENQMRMIDSTVSLNHSFGIGSQTNGFRDIGKLAVNYSLTEKKVENHHSHAGSQSVSEIFTSPHITVVTIHSNLDGRMSTSPTANNGSEHEEPLAASVKKEQSDSPNSLTVSGAGGAHDLRGIQPSKLCVKEESLYSVPYQQSREQAPGMINCTSMGMIKTEMNGHNQPNNQTEGQTPPFTLHIPPAYPSIASPGMTSLLGSAPPRRTPKQHNCSACGKNFSSASALQIHERTHTGEKPFVCSICDRAFTTKGNLKVHMGTHMWNNAPARRGRRLSVENPMALLGGDAMKFGEMFQKDLAARAMNVPQGFWNRYAAAITNGLAMRNNEISVIQNRGIPPLHAMTVGMDRVGTGASPIDSLGKPSMDLGPNRHFSMLVDDSKEIGIN